ncbi:MAG TPA: tetratricopeptide repeat protein [Stellaceae bacterium]|jgi:tetratricopeptide (TPR) repeat protein|nr:tetratricopeptide repeat protein [Stellaceae bacterium]
MLTDRYGLDLSTGSTAAQDAYVQATDLALTFYPGAAEAYDRAVAADPHFAMAHAGKAQVLMRQGDVVGARAALAAAKDVATGLSYREASHIGFFDLVFGGRTDTAIAVLYAHLAMWPCDALVVSVAANPNGLLGGSGRIGQKRQIAVLMDGLAPHYGDDFWFLSYHAMALSEDGRLAAARPKIERSIAVNPNNAHGAHGFAHVCYESGEPETARNYLASWFETYPRDGFFYGHLSWHLSLCEIHTGNWTNAARVYQDAIALDRHSGGPQQKMSDGAAFLWRSELAGHPRDPAAWRGLHDYANSALPRPGSGLADIHVILAQAVMGDAAGPDARARQIEAAAEEGRYASGTYLSSLARGFASFERGDFDEAIAAFEPLAGQNERIGGSRAQHDLIEFTLLRAYASAGRRGDVDRMLAQRRLGLREVPVAGLH